MTVAVDTVNVRHEASLWHRLVPRLLHEHKSTTVAEIGVWRGELSAKILAQCPLVQRLLLVDPWQVVYGKNEAGQHFVFAPGTDQAAMDAAYQEVRAKFVGDSRIRIHKGLSVDIADTIPDGSLDAVLIDGLHTYHACKADILAWWNKVRDGGVLIGDDLSPWYPGVQVAVEEIFGEDYRAIGQTYWRVK